MYPEELTQPCHLRGADDVSHDAYGRIERGERDGRTFPTGRQEAQLKEQRQLLERAEGVQLKCW